MGQTSREIGRQEGRKAHWSLSATSRCRSAGLQVRLSAVANTAATPTGPDVGKREPVREEKTAKTNRGKTQRHPTAHGQTMTVRRTFQLCAAAILEPF